MLEKINPAVVNIATYTSRENDNPLLNDPAFRRFFNIPDQPERRERSAGRRNRARLCVQPKRAR